MSKTIIDKMVDRFLGWKLPKDFYPDAGISFTPTKPYEGDDLGNSWWPVGTNLFTADQARQMFEHALGTAIAPPDRYSTEEEGDAYTHGYFDGLEGANARIAELEAQVKQLELELSHEQKDQRIKAAEWGKERLQYEENIAELTAHCERLKLLLGKPFNSKANFGAGWSLMTAEALSATPAQSLAKLKAETLREAMAEFEDLHTIMKLRRMADDLEEKS